MTASVCISESASASSCSLGSGSTPSQPHVLGGVSGGTSASDTLASPVRSSAPVAVWRRDRSGSIAYYYESQARTAAQAQAGALLGRAKQCYERAVRHAGTAVDARVRVTLDIAPSGQVTNADVDGPDFGGMALASHAVLSLCPARTDRPWSARAH